MFQLAAIVLLCTILTTTYLAHKAGHLPFTPCDISQTGDRVPEYYVFATGLTITALLMARLHLQYDTDRSLYLGLAGAAGMMGLALFNTSTYFITHAAFALCCFLSYLTYVYQRAGFSPLLMCGATIYGLRLALLAVLAVKQTLFVHQVRAVMQHLTVACLFGAVWNIMMEAAAQQQLQSKLKAS